MSCLETRYELGCLLSFLTLVVGVKSAVADGGALRLTEIKGNYEIAVFTAPIPLRAGPVDVSTLIQNAATHQPVADAQVTIQAVRNGRPGLVIRQPATFEAATNKLMRAATLDLGQPGAWRLEVLLDGPHGNVALGFDVEVADPQPRYLTLWRWLVWPLLPIVLYCAHQFLVRPLGTEFQNDPNSSRTF